MGVSINAGTPHSWMVYKGKSHQNGWFGLTPISGNHHLPSHRGSRTPQGLASWSFVQVFKGRQLVSCLKWLVTNIGPDRLGTRLPHIQFDAFPTPFQKLPCKPGSDCSFRNQIEFYPHEKVQVCPHFPRGSLVNSPSASVLRTVLPHSRPTSSTRGPGGKTHRITNRTWGLSQQ